MFLSKGESNKLISVDCSIVHWLKSFVNGCLLFFYFYKLEFHARNDKREASCISML